jgi:hypothetical protein
MNRPSKLLLCTIAASITGCTADIPFTWTEPETPSSNASELSTDLDITIHKYNCETATDVATDIVGNDKSYYWEANSFTEKVCVTFSGNTANVETNVAGLVTHINGAYVTVDFATNTAKNIDITVQGSTDNGALKIYGKNKFKLTLNGAEITSQRGPAINNQCKKRVFVHLVEGSTNKLTDQPDYDAEPYYADDASFATEDAKGCFFSEGNVIMSGSGSLIIDANHKHGLATDGYFWMRPGSTLAVINTAKNAIQAKGSTSENIGIVINGGYLYANAEADGGKCLKSDNNIIINSGYLTLNTSGNATYDAEEKDTSHSSCIKSNLSTAIHGGTLLLKSIGDGGKGINADEVIYITGGSITDMCPNADTKTTTRKTYINGGNIFVYGNDAISKPNEASTQSYVLHEGLSITSGNTLSITSGGTSIMQFTTNFTKTAYIPTLFSCPTLTKGYNYTLTNGDESISVTAE